MNQTVELVSGKLITTGVVEKIPSIAFLDEYFFDVYKFAEFISFIDNNPNYTYFTFPVFSRKYATELGSAVEKEIKNSLDIIGIAGIPLSEEAMQMIDNLEMQRCVDVARAKYYSEMEQASLRIPIFYTADNTVVFSTNATELSAENWFLFSYSTLINSLNSRLLSDKQTVVEGLENLLTSQNPLFKNPRDEITNRTGFELYDIFD